MASNRVEVTLNFPGVSAENLRTAVFGVFDEEVTFEGARWMSPIETAWRRIESAIQLPHEREYPVLDLELGSYKKYREPYQKGSYLIRLFETDDGTRLWVDYRVFSDAWGSEKKLKTMRTTFPSLIETSIRRRLPSA